MGALRLWLPKEEYIQESKSKYLDQYAHTKSETIKNPSTTDVEAMTMHVHARSNALNFQHSFFHGGVGIPYLPHDAPQVEKDDGASDPEQGDSCFIIVFGLPEWILSTLEPR